MSPNSTVDVICTAQSASEEQLAGRIVIVIDVLRATTTMLSMLTNGVRSVRPAVSVEEARTFKQAHPEVLICGERGGLRVDGFDHGNSPLEFEFPHAHRAGFRGVDAVLTTTNGTLAVSRCRLAAAILAGSMRNARAAASTASDFAEATREAGSRTPGIVLLCAGTEAEFSIDDFYAAGLMAHTLRERGWELTDVGWAALHAASRGVVEVVNAASCRHVRKLQSLGLSEDVNFCFQIDRSTAVPRYEPAVGAIVLHDEGDTE